MKRDPAVFTHKGWFWICPIFIGVNAEGFADVEARYSWLEPLFSLCEYFEGFRIWLTSVINPDYEPTFMFRLTGELSK